MGVAKNAAARDIIIKGNAIRAFHRRLHTWYQAHGRRDLPWRNTNDAYAIYLSEIMLQQTQVKTVLERYYFPFLKEFPTLAALASAKQEKVLKAWQGLGYYNRAINLHKAAKECAGALPGSAEALMALPGIGRNTAHAIAAFAFRQPVAVMEANVKRVLCRIFALQTPTEARLFELATGLLDRKNPFDYNQAMMDIGSMVCTKRNPACPACPANIICKGQTSPESYPAPKRKKIVPVRRKNIVVLQNAEGKYFAAPRAGKFLNGLYAFDVHTAEADAAKPLGAICQQYSHFTLEAEVYLTPAKSSGKSWFTLAQLKKLPMSMAEQKILQLLASAKPTKHKR